MVQGGWPQPIGFKDGNAAPESGGALVEAAHNHLFQDTQMRGALYNGRVIAIANDVGGEALILEGS